jgi:hypothetical protein
MSKVVGELESKKIGNGKTDIVVAGTKIGAWHTVKGGPKNGQPHPAMAQLEGCQVGMTVEAEVFDNGQYKNLTSIVIQNNPGHIPAPSTDVPAGSPGSYFRYSEPSGEMERLYLALSPAIYAGVFSFFLAQGKLTEAPADYIEKENHERISAVAKAMIENAYDHFAGLKHTLGQ